MFFIISIFIFFFTRNIWWANQNLSVCWIWPTGPLCQPSFETMTHWLWKHHTFIKIDQKWSFKLGFSWTLNEIEQQIKNKTYLIIMTYVRKGCWNVSCSFWLLQAPVQNSTFRRTSASKRQLPWLGFHKCWLTRWPELNAPQPGWQSVCSFREW